MESLEGMRSATNLMTSRQQPSQLGVIFLTVFVDLVGFSIIFPLYPSMLEYYLTGEGSSGLLQDIVAMLPSDSDVEQSDAEVHIAVLFGGFLGSLYSILQFACAPLWGSLSDRVGRKPVLLTTIGGIALSYLLWFFSGSFLLLVAARMLGGIMSGNISVATAAVADSTGREGRAKGMGIIGAAFGLGFVLGPAVGGLLFLIDLTGPLAAVPGVNRFSAAAGGACLLSLWNLVWVATRFSETLTPEAQNRASDVGRPINPLRLFHPFEFPGVNRANLLYLLFQTAFAGMEFTLIFLARERFQYQPGHIAFMFVYAGLIIALVQGVVVRRVVAYLGEKNLAIVGLLVVLCGLVLTGLCRNQPQLFAGVGLLAVGSALAAPALTALVSLYAPAERQGEVLGVFRSLGALSRAVGPIIACSVYWTFGSQWPYLGGAALLLVPLWLATGLPSVGQQS